MTTLMLVSGGCDREIHHSFASGSNECVDCHQTDYANTANPAHPGLMSTTCGDCHTESAWRPAEFAAHEQAFALTGAHREQACRACHGDPPTYAGTATECVGCHRADYDGSSFPGHDALPTTCIDCHTTDAWRPARFPHDFFPLTGAHAAASCLTCHGDPPVYEGTSSECVSCHRADYDESPFPGHDDFPTTCADCHTTEGWQPARFEHDVFPLEGAHADQACTSCHGDPPVYAGTSPECVGCHRADYDESPFPGHDAFPTTCQSCHTTTAWQPASGGHPENAFPISGRHDMPCADCHDEARGAYTDGQNTDCVGCHSGEHSRAHVDDIHAGEDGYAFDPDNPHFCLRCHPDGSG